MTQVLPNCVLLQIFEYLPCSHIVEILCLNKSLMSAIKEYEWNKVFSFKRNITDDELIDITHKWNMKKINLQKQKKITKKSIRTLNDVEYLDLTYCRHITDECIKDLKNLNYLNISFNRDITDEGIKNLKNIKYINISFCYEITVEGIKNLKNSQHINVTGCPKITNEDIKKLDVQKNIERDDDMVFEQKTGVNFETFKIVCIAYSSLMH